MSRSPPDEHRRDEIEQASLIEWSVAWLMVLAAGVMFSGGLAGLIPG